MKNKSNLEILEMTLRNCIPGCIVFVKEESNAYIKFDIIGLKYWIVKFNDKLSKEKSINSILHYPLVIYDNQDFLKMSCIIKANTKKEFDSQLAYLYLILK